MRIEKGPNAIEPRPPAQQNPAAIPRSGNSAPGNIQHTATTVDLKSMDSLLQVVADSSQIRESVVEDVKRRFQSGELLERQSAAGTARAILNS